MEKKIKNKLREIEENENLTILYANESGSRAWGFHSPDSDYDVRFMYIRPRDWYLSVNERKDTLLYPIDEDDLDVAGWDIRKVLHLMSMSNSSPYEWVNSPICYHAENDFLVRLKELMKYYFNPKKAAHHYMGICKSSLHKGDNGDMFHLKKYFYVLRPLLAAKWVVEKEEIPPIVFDDLLELISDDKEIMDNIRALTEEKMKASEGAYIKKNPVIDNFIHTHLEELKIKADNIKTEHKDLGKVNALFRDLFDEYCL